jgi:predicted double-glycine peptidase
MLWAQLFAFPPLVWLGTRLGLRLGRTPAWWISFSAALAWTCLVIVGRRFPRFSLEPPVSWSVDITLAPFFMAFLVPLLFATLIPRLPGKRRAFIVIVTSLLTINYAPLPAACPLLVRSTLAATRTRINAEGICLQTTPYMCGPSAAITCLRTLGIDADEGPLAIAARSGPMVGTDARFLARTIQAQFADEGVRARCEHLTKIDAMRTPAIAAMNMPLIGGHFIAVLDVTPTHLVIGDPYSGRYLMKRAYFLRDWTSITISLSRVVR